MESWGSGEVRLTTLSRGEGGRGGTGMVGRLVPSSLEEDERVGELAVRSRGGLVRVYGVVSESSSGRKTSVAAGAILECFGDLELR